ncbi:MAG: sigma-70 family RNA polymerase sigma factor [Fimbriimonadales bacterium]|nr:sigma-70 family RNA polymerase sigma factor [Fimbriimonadales bacterium]
MSREALNALLRDLPPELRRAVKDAVARCRPEYRPRLYAHDWLEELYHEAACAACEAQRSYDPAKGSLYAWGMRVIGQRLRRFCDTVWAACREEAEWPCDEAIGEEVEFEDDAALEAMEEAVLCSQVQAALLQLNDRDRQLLEWYFGEEALSERAIAERLGCSHVSVHQGLRRAWACVCRVLGVEQNFPLRGMKSPKKGAVEGE